MSERDAERPAWRDVRTGLLLMAVLLAAALLVFFMDEIRRSLEEGPHLVVEMDEAPALEPGSGVWVAGRPAGRVTRVRFQASEGGAAGSVVIDAVLHREVGGTVRADATARVRESSLLAPMVLAIRPGSPDAPPYDFSDTLRRITESVDREDVSALADSLRTLLREARPVASRFARTVREGPGTLARLRADTLLEAELGRSLARLDRLLPRGRHGFLARMARDTLLSAHLRSIAASLRELRTLGAREGRDAGDLEALRRILDRLAARLDAVEGDLARGRGTLGRALYDSAILYQTRLLRSRMDSLRAELVAHPLRWLRFRIF